MSNLFYYEITIMEQTRKGWNSQGIVIGYGDIETRINATVGIERNTFGYDVKTGCIYANGLVINNNCPKCDKDDVIGIGIIIHSFIRFFATVNGYLISELFEMRTKYSIVPMMTYVDSHKIKYNFGNEPFGKKNENICF